MNDDTKFVLQVNEIRGYVTHAKQQIEKAEEMLYELLKENVGKIE
jgi:ribosomal protein S17E